MDFINKIKQHPSLKRTVLRMLMPTGQARPRWWVKAFMNPFYHDKGENAIIRSTVRKDLLPFNKFSLGRSSVIEDFTVINNGMGAVIIGERTFIGLSNVIIGPVQMGNNIITAQHVVISGLNHGYEDVDLPIRDQPCNTSLITIEDDCWIGANAVITAGVRIGAHSVVAAGSVVTRDVPPFSIAGGNPAKILKRYNADLKKWERT